MQPPTAATPAKSTAPAVPGALAAPALPAELTHRQARQTLAALQLQLRSPGSAAATPPHPGWVVDAGALQVFDSSALAVLLECRRSALAAGQGFAVRGLPPALAGLAALYGVADLLPAAAA